MEADGACVEASVLMLRAGSTAFLRRDPHVPANRTSLPRLRTPSTGVLASVRAEARQAPRQTQTGCFGWQICGGSRASRNAPAIRLL